MSERSENRAIARAAGLVGSFTLLSRIAGLARDVVVGYLFGSGAAADAFFVAFRIPNLLRRFVAEGAMTAAFIPVLSEYLTLRGSAEAARAARAVASVFALALVALTAAGVLGAPLWTRLLAPGFAADPGKLALTISLTRLVFPYILLVSLVALVGAILNTLRHFAVPALAPLFFNVTFITAALLLAGHVAPPIYSLAYGVLAGGVVQLAVLIPPLVRRGFALLPTWEPRHDAVRRSLHLMLPVVFGAAVYQVNVMVDTIFASSLPNGAVSYLWYAGRVFEFPLGIFAVALGTAALPSFSTQAARRAYEEMGESVVFSVRLTTFAVVPAAIGIALLATPICSVLFERGAFTGADAALTAQALAAFAVGLWSVSLVRILVPTFYAMQDVRTPVIAAAAAFVSNVVFSLMFMGPIRATGASSIESAIAAATAWIGVADLRHAGLALSTSLAATVNLVLLVALLRLRLPRLRLTAVLPTLARSLAASALMAWPVLHIARLGGGLRAPFATRAAALAAAVLIGMAIYTAASWAFRSPEINTVARLLRERVGTPPARD